MTRLVLALLLAASLSACRSAPPVVKTAPAPAPAPEPDDAFSTFGGQVAALGEEVSLHREPVGIAEVRALVVLGRTEWEIRTRGDGGEDKTATANFVVQRGDNAGNVRITAGESGSALGITITVHDAGETYEEATSRWVQFAKVTFSLTP